MERESTPMPRLTQALIFFLIGASLAAVGCNVFGNLDPPGDRQDKYAAALAMANDGNCKGAKELLESILPPDDDVLSALGWANMCLAGATASNIASSIYTFTSSSNNKTVIGVLARTMLPMTGDKSNNATAAVNAFSQITDNRRRGISLGIANVVTAAAILANQALNNSATTLEKTDISGATCSTFSGNCTGATGTCTAGMSNADVTSYITAVDNAITALNLIGTNTDISQLAAAIRSGLVADDTGRCLIFNEMIPQ